MFLSWFWTRSLTAWLLKQEIIEVRQSALEWLNPHLIELLEKYKIMGKPHTFKTAL